jgi:hypothetical protein
VEAALNKLQTLAKSTQQSVAASTSSMVAAAGAPAVAAAAAASSPIPGYPMPSSGGGFRVSHGPISGPGPLNAAHIAEWHARFPGIPIPAGYGPAPAAPQSPYGGAFGFSAPTGASGWNPRALAGANVTPSGWDSAALSAAGAVTASRYTAGGGPAYGPVSDPGSAGQSSMSTARGYDQAMLRGRVTQANQYFAAAYDAGGSINKTAIGMNQLGAALTNLAAGIVLTNKAAEEGADAWQNLQTKFVGGMNIAVGSGMALRGAQNLATGAGGMALRGVNLAAGAAALSGFGGTASILGRLGAPLGMAGMAAGGLVAGGGLGVAAYLGYQLYDANQQNEAALARGQDLDARIGQQNRIRNMAAFAPYAARRNAVDIGTRIDSLRLAGGMSFDRFQGNALMRFDALENDSASLRTMAGQESRDPGDRLDANRQIKANLEQQLRITDQLGAAGRHVLETEKQRLRAVHELTEVERTRAQSASGDIGRISHSDWRRRDRLVTRAGRGGLSERVATEIESIGGATAETEAWFRKRGQSRVDEAPGFVPTDARSSDQMQALDAKIKQLEVNRSQVASKILDTFNQQARVEERLLTALGQVSMKISDLEARLSTWTQRR